MNPPQRAGLRVVAAFEAAKGAIVLLAGCGAFALVHRDLQALAEEIVQHFHLNPASGYPRIFLDLAARADGHLALLGLGAFAYAAVRFVEAYGLWRARIWGEWFAALAGAVYLPFEIYELSLALTRVRLGLFALNLSIVAYLARQLWRERSGERRPVSNEGP